MASNALERAVIAAARQWRHGHVRTIAATRGIEQAIDRLETWEASQEPTLMEVGWHEVTEGDRLKSIKTGKFYAVTGSLKVKGGYAISVQGAPKPITRPTLAEPTAWVKRGPTGSAVDTLTHVFSSGGD